MPREKLYDRKTDTRTARLFLIACEGETPERPYFEALAEGLRRVRVVALSSPDGLSAPIDVVERLNISAERKGLKLDDEVWMVIDTDHWFTDSHLPGAHRALDMAAQRGYNVAINNQCIEAWLLYHFEDVAPHSSEKELEERLRVHLGGYSKTKMDFEQYRAHVAEAMRRARAADTAPDERLPAHPGSRVYRLLEAMRAVCGVGWPFGEAAE